ncbi:MAG: NAD(+) synthase [Prevotellaceae bacterium]|jgi:NAD+ synthase (glutamine-hydrolysing)|nr:NAD(+) synthase [Prevotellaceae bacterium]
MSHQFLKIAASIPEVSLANCQANATQLLQHIQQATKQGVHLLCFPELCLTGASCGDLFHNELLLSEAEKALQVLLTATEDSTITVVATLPVRHKEGVYKVSAVCAKGNLLAVVPTSLSKIEKSIFDAPAELLAEKETSLCGQAVSCSSGFVAAESFSITVSNSFSLPKTATDVLVVPAALPATAGQAELLRKQAATISATQAVVFVSAGFGESTTDGVFAGQALIAGKSEILAETELYKTSAQMITAEITPRHAAGKINRTAKFVETAQKIDNEMSQLRFATPDTTGIQNPFLPPNLNLAECCQEAFAIQTQGLLTRLQHTGINKVLLGVSGGLDSTLALLVCVNVFDKMGIPRKQITGITMPGFGTTGRTYRNAVELIQKLGVSFREISIKEACLQHFNDINQPINKHDTTYENAQARERTQILMDIANQQNALVIGTGDLSELALGWATYGGDHLSMYCVNGGVPKTMVRHIVAWAADTEPFLAVKNNLRDIIDTPISPELLPSNEENTIGHKTEDLVGPYELHDFFLYHLLKSGSSPARLQKSAEQVFTKKYSVAVINKWLRVFLSRFFSQQFKRSCMPDCPQVFEVSLSPRNGFRMPSDASAKIWLEEAENL